ncbi:MAG TPA: hypothetical protein VGZ47_20710 [Gemmataceae bacterium]|nr:hypothetical protein [Gemmataceae bacterium]
MNEMFAAPDPFRSTIFVVGLPILWVATGLLKSRGFGQEGDIRKINHVVAFTGGALLFGWLPEPIARSSMYATSPVILLLVVLTCRFRSRPPFSHAFAANTRKRDAPHEAFYFWSSWLISMLAVAAIDLTFRQLAITRTAALVVGIADGLAEPIGRRLGRHCYRVPSLRVNGLSVQSREARSSYSAHWR